VTPRLPLSVVIPAGWTPEQAIAVLELLNDLRHALWAVHGERIQQYLQRQQASVDTSSSGSGPSSDDTAF